MIEPWLSRPELIHTLALVRFFSQRSLPVFTLKKMGILGLCCDCGQLRLVGEWNVYI